MKGLGRWIGALALAGLVHAGLVYVFLPSPPPPSAPAQGDGFVLSFAGLASAEAAPSAADATQAAASAPASVATASPDTPSAEAPQPEEPLPEVEPVETETGIEPVEAETETATEAVTEALPDRVVETAPQQVAVLEPMERLEPVQRQSPPAPALERVDAPKPVAAAVAPAKPVRPVEPQPPAPEAVAVPETQQEAVPRPRDRPPELVKATPKRTPPKRVARVEPAPPAARPAPVQGSGAPGAATQAAPRPPSANPSAAGGAAPQTQTTGSPEGLAKNQDYVALLHAWLAKHRDYPRTARMRRQEGVVMLYFAIDRDGHLLRYRIERSSGFDLLDQAAEAMIQRAAPLPPVPAELFRERFEVVVPVRFTIS